MLFDPKWETKTDPWAVPSFVAWLETQPPEKTYDWMNCSGGCLIGQYMAKKDIEWNGVNYEAAPNHFQTIACRHPHTFGAALQRARGICGND